MKSKIVCIRYHKAQHYGKIESKGQISQSSTTIFARLRTQFVAQKRLIFEYWNLKHRLTLGGFAALPLTAPWLVLYHKNGDHLVPFLVTMGLPAPCSTGFLTFIKQPYILLYEWYCFLQVLIFQKIGIIYNSVCAGVHFLELCRKGQIFARSFLSCWERQWQRDKNPLGTSLSQYDKDPGVKFLVSLFLWRGGSLSIS